LAQDVCITRVGQNRIYTQHMTVYLVISLPKIPYIHRIYMVSANPMHYTFIHLGASDENELLLVHSTTCNYTHSRWA